MLLARTRRRSHPRGILGGVVLAAALAALSVALPAWAAPPDQPSVHQYSDPFAPLGTGHQTPAWNPFDRDFREAAPARVRRRLAKAEDAATFELLLAQLQTERVRTRQGSDAADTSGGRARTEDDEPGATGSAASSVFEVGGTAGALLLAGLGMIAAGGAVAVWARRRQYTAGPRGS